MSPFSRRRSGLVSASCLLTACVLIAAPAAQASPGPAPGSAPAAHAGDLALVPGSASTPIRLGGAPRSSLVPEVDRRAAGTGSPGTGSPGSGLRMSVAPVSTWQVDYTGAFTPEAQAAFGRAVDIWAHTVPSAVTVHVHASMADLGDRYLLGYSGPGAFYTTGQDPSGTAYPVAALEAIRGTDVNATSSADIQASFNTNPINPWYFDTGAPGTSKIDFASVVLHELGHGLGLTGFLNKSGAVGSYGAHPALFDRYVTSTRPSSQSVLAYADGSSALGTALTSGTLAWAGPLGTASAGGSRPALYSPGSWQEGSSVYHLDERTYPQGDPNSLMTPLLNAGEVIRDPGDIALGMLSDMGYPPLQVQRYVNALYLDFLGRPVDPAGQASWTDSLVTGRLTRYQLALALATTDEYLGTVVSQLYRDVLGREPDPAGLDSWRRAIRGGTPIATVGASFYSSDENYARTGGTAGNPGPWVEGLYQALLGRASDPGGKAHWIDVSRTQGRLVVTTAFYGSLETLQRRVQQLYGTLLGRPADPTGLAGWPAVVSARGDLALAASLASSAEYYDRAQGR